jgi:hypothetical protein
MTDPLQVTPSRLRAVANDLADLSSRMNDVWTTLGGKLDATGPVWGDDSTGDQFAKGPNGYEAQALGVRTTGKTQGDFLDELFKNLSSSSGNFTNQDQA